MNESRDRCPVCGNKLHPQEMEALFRGRKLECWHCDARLRARAKGHLSSLAQTAAGLMPVTQTFIDAGSPAWNGFAFAAIVIGAIHLLPPGLIHGASWVRIVHHQSPFVETSD